MEANPRERRLVAVDVSYDMLIQMMFEGFETVGRIKTTEGLPAGAKLVREYFDPMRAAVVFIFHHESFDEVSENSVIPHKRIIHRMIVEESVP